MKKGSLSTTTVRIWIPLVFLMINVSVVSATDTPQVGGATKNGGCDEKTKKCLLLYSKKEMTSEDITKYIREGNTCFSRDPKTLAKEAACFLPMELGIDSRNGQTVELKYFCSDVCPDYGGVVTDYKGVKKEECCKVGGNPTHDPAWGGYIGCQPKEVPLPRFFWPDEKGIMRLAERNPCNPSEVTIVGDIPDDWRNR